MPPAAQQPDTQTPTTAWNDQLLANPHAVADKRRRVRDMFAAIAPSYDINNRLHSAWQDQRWRRRAVKLATLKQGDQVVDVACGTGDLTLAFEDALARLPGDFGNVIGIDFTYAMLPIATRKATRAHQDTCAVFVNGDAQSLPLPDESADVVSIA